jgi:hypothetical protein
MVRFAVLSQGCGITTDNMTRAQPLGTYQYFPKVIKSLSKHFPCTNLCLSKAHTSAASH